MTNKLTHAPKVSILVPIYNVEKYLRQCLDSLVSQTLEDIEIICINDGSTDSSPEIINEYAKRDPRIVVITKKNSGYGDSMNTGLDKARGEYIGIVESDDWAEPNMFEDLYNLASSNKAEAVKSNFYFYSGLGGTRKKHPLVNPDETNKIINPKNNPHIFFQMATIWSAIYSREFLTKHGIRFLPSPGASYQDTGFNFKVWASTERAYFTNEAYLHYRIDNEASSVKSRSKVFCVHDEFTEIKRFLIEKNLLKELAPIFEQRKFDIYYWNLARLRGRNAIDFLRVMRKEFLQDRADGLLDMRWFEPGQKRTLNNILKYGDTYFTLKYAQRGARKALRTTKHAITKLSPSYHHAQHAVELNQEILENTRTLEEKLHELTKEIEHLKKK